MRIVNRKNKTVYRYDKYEFPIGVKHAIALFVVAVFLLVISIVISFFYMGEAPSFIAGIGISSILFNVASITNIILEVYLYKNFHAEIRNMLILNIAFFIVWIFII